MAYSTMRRLKLKEVQRFTFDSMRDEHHRIWYQLRCDGVDRRRPADYSPTRCPDWLVLACTGLYWLVLACTGLYGLACTDWLVRIGLYSLFTRTCLLSTRTRYRIEFDATYLTELDVAATFDLFGDD